MNNLKRMDEIREKSNKKGFKGLVGFIQDLFKKIKADESMPYAYQLTYSLLFAVFPFLIFLFTLIGFLNFNTTTVLNAMRRVLPGQTFTLISDLLKGILESQSGGLLSISIILAIWSASGGFRAFIKAMNKIFNMGEKRSFLIIILQSVLFVFVLALGIILSLVLMVFGNQLFNFLSNTLKLGGFDFFKSVLKYIAPLFVILMLFTVFYMFVPSRNIRFRYAFPGAVFSTIAFMITTFGFQIYVDNFANYSKFYGTLGTVIVLMTWLLLLSIIMILGAEINSLLIIKANCYPFIDLERKVDFKKVKEKYRELGEYTVPGKARIIRESVKEDIKKTRREKDESWMSSDLRKKIVNFDKNNDRIEDFIESEKDN